MYRALYTKQFKKDVKKIRKSGKDTATLKEAMSLLINDGSLPVHYKDHNLKGSYIGCRECHLRFDWLLIYRIEGDTIIFIRSGTHAELFE